MVVENNPYLYWLLIQLTTPEIIQKNVKFSAIQISMNQTHIIHLNNTLKHFTNIYQAFRAKKKNIKIICSKTIKYCDFPYKLTLFAISDPDRPTYKIIVIFVVYTY